MIPTAPHTTREMRTKHARALYPGRAEAASASALRSPYTEPLRNTDDPPTSAPFKRLRTLDLRWTLALSIALVSLIIAALHIILLPNRNAVYLELLPGMRDQSAFTITLCRAAWMFVPLGFVTITALIWSWALKREVSQRTAQLQQELIERRQTEMALRESEARLRDVTEAATDWVWEMDAQLRFTYLSDRFYALTHIVPEQVLGKMRWDLVPRHAMDIPKWDRHRDMLSKRLPFRDFIYQADIHGEMVDATRPTVRRLRTLKISGKPIYDAEGQFWGYRGTGTDITEQVSAEAALHATELRLQQIIDLVPHMIFAKDRRGHFVLANRATAEAYGTTIEELVHPWYHEEGEEISARIWADDLEVMQTQSPKSIAAEIFTDHTGRNRILQTSKIPFIDPRTNEIAALSVAVDITAETRAKEDVARMRSYLKNVIDSMPSVLIGVDPLGNIAVLNQQAEQVCGMSWEAAQGRFFGELFPQFSAQYEQVQEAIQSGEPVKMPRMSIDEQGELRYADIMVYPLVADGTCGAVIRMDDVTARVRMESMMMQTEKMLSIGGLAAGMAHEINNPLGVILQGCQSVLRRLEAGAPRNQTVAKAVGVDLEAVRDYLARQKILELLESVRDAGSRAAKIVADMLSFSRQTEIRHEKEVLVEEMIETVLRLAASDYDLKKRYDFKRITIQRDYDPALKLIFCNKTEIEQVILNLLKNAAQALLEKTAEERPAPMIVLRTRCEGHCALIEVIDNGPGIGPGIIGRIFEPFFTTKEVGVGTGLGLSVSYFIVTQQHRGQLSVVSKEGQGAHFIMRLPLQPQQEIHAGCVHPD